MDLEKREDINDIKELRRKRFDELPLPQELYNEILVKYTKPVVFIDNGKEVGYGLINDEGVLYEFYLIPSHVPEVEYILTRLLKEYSIHKIVCQSFDHLIFSQCIIRMKSRKMIGYNFRERIESKQPVDHFDLKMRKATMDDHDIILNNREEIFDDSEVGDIPYYINKGAIFMFEDDKGVFHGYGLMNRTLPDRNWYDVGMLVHPDHRGKGVATFIIDRLADQVTMMGGVPNAGCAFDNIGSKKTLERAGFITRYVMVEFEV